MAKEKAPGVLADGKGAQTQDDDTTKCAGVQGGKSFEQRIFDEMWEKSKEFADGSGIDWSELAFLPYEDYEKMHAWWFIGYPESMDADWYGRMTAHGLQGVAFDHDRCKWPDGTPKKEHIHMILYFGQGTKSYAQMKRLAEDYHMVRPQPIDNIVGAVRYGLHLDIQPDKRPEDRGKARYDRSHMVTFGGFDVDAYLKATKTQLAQVLKELYGLIREHDFTQYHQFIDWVYLKKPEYEFVLANPHVTGQIARYITSRYLSLHPNNEVGRMQMLMEYAQMTGDNAAFEAVKDYLGV